MLVPELLKRETLQCTSVLCPFPHLLREKIKQESSSSAVAYVQLEITDPASVAAAAKTVEAAEGHLDILVNNAGPLPPFLFFSSA